MIYIKEALFLLLAFLDAEFTKRRLSTYGIEVEMNPTVRALCKVFGVARGVDLGVCIPTAAFMIAGWYFPDVLTFMLGVRFCLFILQRRAEAHGN